MRGVLSSTLFALVLGTSLAVPSCPLDDVLLGNPADCTTFYQCLNGVAQLQHCPAGLHWSTSLNRCEFPEVAQCEESEEQPPTTSRPSSTEGLSTTQGPRPNSCPEEDGPEDVLLPNPDDCGSFFKCLNGIPHLIACPPGQEWSIEYNRCDFPSIAQCSEQGNVDPTPERPSTTQGPRPDSCPEENGPEDVLLPNPDDCGSFFKCLNGIPHLIQCPPGQEWSIELSRCDFPSIAQCSEQGNVDPTPVGPSTTQGPRPDSCPEENGPEDVLLPNPDDCGSFFKCLNGIPHLIQCPPGQEWSIELSRCDFPSIAQCSEQGYVDPITPQHPGKTENGCPAEDGPQDILLPNPADCGSFYKCSGGTPVLQECPAGLHWNDNQQYCDFPEIAQCVETESSVATQTSPSSTVRVPSPPAELPDHCPDEDGPVDVLLPNPDDCESFFKCLGGIPHLIPCPPGLHWHQEIQQCDYPALAQCEERIARAVPFFRDESSEEDECPAHNSGFDIFFPNPEDCSTYYQCSNGVKILKHCGEGTLWHASMERCDHAANAVCAE